MFLGNTRKILVTGSVPTENLPTKKHDSLLKPARRTLFRKTIGDVPSLPTTSAGGQPLPTVCRSLEELKKTIDEEVNRSLEYS